MILSPRRYRLRAGPIADLPFSTDLANEFNNDPHPDYFFFRFNAIRAADFYTHVLGMPVNLTVEKTKTK